MAAEITKIDEANPVLLQKFHDKLRARFIKYTRRAYNILPGMTEPSILDIGCGTGIPTMELMALSGGHVTAIDIDRSKLDILMERAKRAGVSERISVVRCSMQNLKFPDNSFDLIWTEGAIAVIGFEKGVKEWRRFIKPGGFLVVHDMNEDIEQKKQQAERHGYRLIEHFSISGATWWSEYYKPLEEHIERIYIEHKNEPVILAQVERDRLEVEKVKNNPHAYSSGFFILCRKGK